MMIAQTISAGLVALPVAIYCGCAQAVKVGVRQSHIADPSSRASVLLMNLPNSTGSGAWRLLRPGFSLFYLHDSGTIRALQNYDLHTSRRI